MNLTYLLSLRLSQQVVTCHPFLKIHRALILGMVQKDATSNDVSPLSYRLVVECGAAVVSTFTIGNHLKFFFPHFKTLCTLCKLKQFVLF